MSRYSKQLESEVLVKEFLVNIKPFEDDLVERFLEKGFELMCESLELNDEFYKKVLFVYLVKEKRVLKKVVERNKRFFLGIICSGRGDIIRPMLGIQSIVFDCVWKEILDDITRG